MSTSVTFNGTSYTVPALADASWGTNVSNYLIAIATGCLQKTGGTFTLTAEVNFGATYGIKAARLKSQTTNIAAAGFLWLAKTDTINWRNNANDGDLPLGIDSSNRLTFNSLPITTLALGAANTVLRMNAGGTATEYATLVNANIDAAAAIAYSKLALTGAILNADLAGSIAYSKLALTGAVLNADLAGSIADSKLSTISTALKVSNSATTAASANTASAIVARDGSGNFSAGTITAALAGNATTATTAGTLSGVLGPALGGTGVANNAAATTTRSGNFAKTETLTNTTSITYPTAGTLATLAGTEAFTAKDYQGGTASDTSRITVPKAALATLTGLTRKQGTLVYDTVANQLLADDGTNLNAIGSGSGEKNYITGPSTASGWAASGAGITVATDVTGSDLPRPNTTKTGILLTGVSGSTAYAYFRIILDDADANKKLKVQFDMKPGTAVASDFKVDVYSNTANDYTTGNTRLALSTDSSAVSALPALTGTYRTTFDAPAVSAKYIEIRVGMNATQTHTLVISDVVVGPGVVQQGAALTEWVSYTPTGAWSTNTTWTGRWRRVGDSMEVQFRAVCSGAPTAASFTVLMPTGYTVDTSKMPASIQDGMTVGHGSVLDSATRVRDAVVVYSGTGGTMDVFTDYITTSTTGYISETNPITFGNLDSVSGHFRVPIAEWAGSGTVNVVQNDVEYAYNSSGLTTANTSDTTSFAYGPGGAATGSIDSSQTAAQFTTMRVHFLTPIQATDKLAVEIKENNEWIPAESRFPPSSQLTARFGIHLVSVSASTTDVDVRFGNAGVTGSGATYGAVSATTWASASLSWRVRKSSGGQAVGFSEASTTSLGLVKPSHTALAGAQNSYSAGTGLVRSGTYTPTLANVANVASSVVAANSMIWTQVGQVVHCSGYLTTTETAGGPTDTQFTLTLPVVPTSNFAQLYEAGGTCTSKASTTIDNPGQVYATTSAKTVTCQFASTVTTATRDLTYTFQYLAN